MKVLKHVKSINSTILMLIVVFNVLLLFLLPVSANPNQIWASDDGGIWKNFFYSNEAVYVTGDLDPTEEDFVFPTARIYVTENQEWVGGESLTDVTPGGYNVISGYLLGGGFLGEVVWLPPLTKGEYDLVIDENQNGLYDGIDYVSGEGNDYAFRVESAIGPPTLDKSKIKANAQELADTYRSIPDKFNFSLTATMAIKRVGLAAKFALAGYPAVGIGVWFSGFIIPLSYDGAVARVGKLVVAGLCKPVSEHYQALANDPPDPDYTTLVDLEEFNIYPIIEESSYVIAQTNLINNLEQQGAILEALTKSIEKYEGAKEAGNETYILLHAKNVKKFSEMLVANLNETVTLLEDYNNEVKKWGGNQTINASDIRDFQKRINMTGFTTEELHSMREFGMNETEIMSLKQWILKTDTTNLTDFNEYDDFRDLGDIVNNSISDFEALSFNAAEINSYYTPFVELHHPSSIPGGPYFGYEGSNITFNGSASTDPDDDILTYQWDFDGDCDFNDRIGAVVNWSWDIEYSGWICLKVTDSSGLTDTNWTKVKIHKVNTSPLIDSFYPVEPNPTINDGDLLVFNVSAFDPDGDLVFFNWTLDDIVVSENDTWVYISNVSDSGKFVKLRVSDGNQFSQDALLIWRLVKDVTPPASITNVKNITYSESYINWTWSNPVETDFSHVMVYLNGIFKENVSMNYYNATNLSPGTNYTISTHTVDTSGNINSSWVNHTARTVKISVTTNCGDVNCNGINMGDVILLLNNVTYGYPLCSEWSGDVNCNGINMGDVILLLNNVTYGYPLNCCEM